MKKHTYSKDSFKRELKNLPINEIKENPYQSRSIERIDPNDVELQKLKKSIEQQDLLSPIEVRKKDGEYLLVAGWRRLTVFKLLNKETIPAIIYSEMDESTHRKFTIIENEQRTDLSLIEKARNYNILTTEEGMNQKQIAELVGSSNTRVSRILQLIKLPSDLQNALNNPALSDGHIDEMVRGYRLRKGNDEALNWVCSVIDDVVKKELTIENIREYNRDEKNKLDLKNDAPKHIRRSRKSQIDGGGWESFRIDDDGSAFLEFQIPKENLECDEKDEKMKNDIIKNKILDYIKHNLFGDPRRFRYHPSIK
jgi:ParB family transcriptional regulator, chromosome partitioning protein